MPDSRVERLLWMQQRLIDNGILYKRQCAEKFAITLKTVQRDIDVLRGYYSESGKDLTYDRAADGYKLLDRHLINAIGTRIKELYPEKRVLYVSAHLFQVQYTDSVTQGQ